MVTLSYEVYWATVLGKDSDAAEVVTEKRLEKLGSVENFAIWLVGPELIKGLKNEQCEAHRNRAAQALHDAAHALQGCTLYDYDSGDVIRAASREERLESYRQSYLDGGAGVIKVEGKRCYVGA